MRSNKPSPKSRPQKGKANEQEQEPEASPQEKLQAAHQDREKWSKVALLPGLSPAAAAWARGMARSAASEASLREKGLAFQEPQQTDDNLTQALGINPSLLDPRRSLGQQNPLTSTKPGTSGSKI